MAYLRGAFVMFMPVVGLPTPNVVVFQYNPETLNHTWTQAQTVAATDGANPLAVRSMPGEAFSFELAMDANESIAEGGIAGGVAEISGLHARISALEMLQYPTGKDMLGELLGTVSAGIGSALGISLGGGGGDRRAVPLHQLPTVLFVWGPGRIVPVTVTGLSITERLHDARLNPLQARATVSVRVLTQNEIGSLSGPLKGVAKAAFAYSQSLRQAGAVTNLGNATESVIGMLPA